VDQDQADIASSNGAGLRGLPRSRADLLLDVMSGILVLGVYAFAQLRLLLGPQPFDPAKYFTSGISFPDVAANLWTLRIGLVAPVHAAALLFGRSEAALYAVPLAAGFVLVAAVYGTMLLLFKDRVVAAAAALVTVLNTSYMLDSSFIFPDTVATATITVGFFFLILGGRRIESVPRVVAIAAPLGAGVFFGWSYLIREFSPILLPAVAAGVFLLRYPWRRIVLLAGAAVTTAALELLYGLVQYGDPFIHLHELQARGDQPFRAFRAVRAEHIQGQLGNPLDSLLVFPRLLLSWQAGWAILFLVAVFVVAAVWLRDWRLWFLATWCFGFWAVMVLFGWLKLPSGRWIINVTNIRYWYPMFPALAMGAFGGGYLLIRRLMPSVRGSLVAQAAVVVLALATLIPGFFEFKQCEAKDVWRNDPRARWDDLRAWFGSEQAQQFNVVYTNKLTTWLLPAFIRTTFGERLWPGAIQEFPHPPQRLVGEDDLEHTLVLVNKDQYRASLVRGRDPFVALRGDWSPVFFSDDGLMVVLAYTPNASEDAGRPGWLEVSPRASTRDGCGLSPYEP
jgi:hypothetical protein